MPMLRPGTIANNPAPAPPYREPPPAPISATRTPTTTIDQAQNAKKLKRVRATSYDLIRQFPFQNQLVRPCRVQLKRVNEID